MKGGFDFRKIRQSDKWNIGRVEKRGTIEGREKRRNVHFGGGCLEDVESDVAAQLLHPHCGPNVTVKDNQS